MIYLASPYSHEDPSIEAYRFDAVCRTAARLIVAGVVVVSPIAHSHPIYVREPATGATFEQWQELDETLLLASEEMWILGLPGWEQSRGVNSEARFAARNGIPVKVIDTEGNIIEDLTGGMDV